MFQAEDLLNAFFGGGGGNPMMTRSGGGSRRAEDTVVAVPTTLEELYCGAKREVTQPRSVLCRGCRGSGTKANASKAQTRCPMCRGAGARVVVQQMGMMMQRMQVACEACGGTGQRIDPNDRCRQCAGTKIAQEEVRLAVNIERGMSDGERIVFRGKGNASPDVLTPADVVVVLQAREHATFVRHEDDLHVKHTITFAEALCGFQFKITQLDGRELAVRRDRGAITRPGEMNVIRSEGMPKKDRKNQFGDLFVHLDITYPETLTAEQLEALREALPRPAILPSVNQEDFHTCYASRTSVAAFRAEMEQEEIDDDDDNGAQGVHVGGCPMQ